MNEEDNQDPLEKLNEGLYSPDSLPVNKILKRNVLSDDPEKISQIPTTWHQDKKPDRFGKLFGWTTREQPIFKKILWFALGFFVLCFALAAFLYVKGINTVSPNKIDIGFSGPLSVSASNPFSLDISVTNKNTSDLSDADILVDYPDGSRSVEDNTKPFVADFISIGTIKKEEFVKKRSEAVLFGQEGEKKIISVTLHYKVPGSTSVFEKKADYQVLISSAPVTASVDSVKELNSNQEITFNIKVTSNSSNLLKNVAVIPTYPFGFTFLKSAPSFTSTGSTSPPVWVIDSLEPAESREFSLTGRLKGEKDEDKYFKFQIGNVEPSNPQRITTQFVNVERLIAIKLPFISSEIALGEGGNKDTVKVGQTRQASISYRNNLNTDVNDLELILKLNDNNLIEKNRIQANGGFYSSLDNTITWNKKTDGALQTIAPGQEGHVTFNLPFISPSVSALNSGSLKNLMVNLELTIKGKRLSDDNVPEEIVLLDSKTIKVGTQVDINAKTLYGSGPFDNTGGIPPRVNKATSYTVVWALSNTLNEVQNGVMTANLPPYVTFEGSISPALEKVSFDKSSNTIRWDTGTIFAGQGYRTSAKTVAFKIILTPSANQVGNVPALVQKIHFEGTDSFTGEAVQDDLFDLNTELRQDPTYKYGQDKVIR